VAFPAGAAYPGDLEAVEDRVTLQLMGGECVWTCEAKAVVQGADDLSPGDHPREELPPAGWEGANVDHSKYVTD
jgi:hypothetical protein